MHARSLTCAFCGAEHPLEVIYHCEGCGGTLDVQYDYARALADEPFASAAHDRSSGHPSPRLRRPPSEASAKEGGIWRYRRLLPVRAGVEPVTLGEGGTPLMPAARLAREVGHECLYLKNETVNPTLSFKDRPISVALTVARQFGVGEVVTASTGNTGVAAAAYAALAGIPCSIYVPRGTPPQKLAIMRAYGARLSEVPGSFSDAHSVATREAEEKGAFNLTSTFLNPYALEGDKTVAYEIVQQYGDAPDWIVIPVGAGPLLVGCYKGFKELRLAGKASRLPRMVGAQALGCSPIVRAFEQGLDEVQPWGEPETVASGIADPLTSYPQDGTRTLRSIRESDGLALGVSDEATLECLRMLATHEGILAEPAAATSVAAARRMIESGQAAPDTSIVCVVTGHGIKDLGALPTP